MIMERRSDSSENVMTEEKGWRWEMIENPFYNVQRKDNAAEEDAGGQTRFYLELANTKLQKTIKRYA